MHDNASAHSIRTVIQYLDSIGIAVLELPPNSSNANPIEHIVEIMTQGIQTQTPAPNSIVELRSLG